MLTTLTIGKRLHGTPPGSGRSRDRGQAAVEFVGVISLLLVAALAAIQLGIAAYAMQQAGTASRAAARAATYRESTMTADQAGRAALSDWLAKGSGFTVVGGNQQVKVTARVPIPSVLPLFDLPDARRSTVMPLD
ncbi:TadE/TadG family type IV pilus assembly protein [Streptomyces paludis]|uniref:Pilus assembly protein n=1 Tax=Streptomyces paludis TaxID=2282738 RepID=A0A345HTJ0_9ACTN|nr:TadE/TadG family type IV pilus assembly protein [Streptomyces paludis]AXG80014.1 pilus assembly protein [Streptomyces paludis]